MTDIPLRSAFGHAILGLAAIGIAAVAAVQAEAQQQPAAQGPSPQALDDILTLNQGVLDTPMSPDELAAARENILSQYRSNPAGFAKSLPDSHVYAEILRHGSPYEREQVVWKLRTAWLDAKPSNNPGQARWIATIKRHTSVDAVLVTAGAINLTSGDVDDNLLVYALMLEHTLTTAQRDALRTILIQNFQKDPAAFQKGHDELHKALTNYASGSATDRERFRSAAWDLIVKNARQNPQAAGTLGILVRDPSVVVATDDAVIRRPQIDAMFSSNDIVAELAPLPHSTDADRAALASTLPAKYPSLPDDQKTRLKEGELRLAVVEEFVLQCSAERAAAVKEIHETVHGPADIPKEAAALEMEAAKFAAVRQKAQEAAMHQMMLGMVAYMGQSNLAALHAAAPNVGTGPQANAIAENRQFEGQMRQFQALSQFHLTAVHAIGMGSIPACK